MRELIQDAEQKTKDKSQERKDLQTQMEQLSKDNSQQKEVVEFFCDLHGHSKKKNIFV